eukprot:GCRY01003939.1.p1 GENE.GCRY01003939.1~~GCRY01003939.1.p1  ORF type:complete len:158 (-),score=6.96 GCRY01003939.1:141-614(-)
MNPFPNQIPPNPLPPPGMGAQHPPFPLPPFPQQQFHSNLQAPPQIPNGMIPPPFMHPQGTPYNPQHRQQNYNRRGRGGFGGNRGGKRDFRRDNNGGGSPFYNSSFVENPWAQLEANPPNLIFTPFGSKPKQNESEEKPQHLEKTGSQKESDDQDSKS